MSHQQRSIAELFEDGRAIDEALRLAAQDALRRHKQLGHSIPVWRKGRVVWIEPEDIQIDEPAREP